MPQNNGPKIRHVNKVVLAYSGGLDTSIILKWLQTTYRCEVVTFTADLGQGEELAPARDKALLLGIKPENIFIEDLREEFVRDYVFPMFRANALYEGQYLLGTSIARPLIAKRQIEIARKVGADAVCHGATDTGNDQVRFELGYYALEPDIKVIAPWREWEFASREALLDFAEKHQIPIAAHRGIESITLDGGAMHLKDELMPRYAKLIYNGFWFSPEREMLQAAIDKSQEHVSGRVRLKLYKGNATVIGRESADSLYDQDLVTFEEGSGAYDQRDAAGFIKLNALRLRTLAQRKRKLES